MLILKATLPRASTTDLFTTTVHVDPFSRKDGTYVEGHDTKVKKKVPVAKLAPAAAPQVDLFAPRAAPLPQMDLFAHQPAAKVEPPVAAAPPADSITVSPSLEEAIPGVTDAVREMAARLLPGYRVNLAPFAPKDPRTGLISSPHTDIIYGMSNPVLPNGEAASDFTISIGLLGEDGKPRSRTAMLSTVLHEMGHAFQLGRMNAAEPATREAIVQQWMASTTGSKLEYSDADTVQMKQWILRGVDESLLRSKQARDPNLKSFRYFDQFEEWCAERFVSWIATKKPDASAIGRFFAESLDALRSAFDRAASMLGIPAFRTGAFERFADDSWRDASPPPPPSQESGPKEGDTKAEGGVTYTLRDGRWHAPSIADAVRAGGAGAQPFSAAEVAAATGKPLGEVEDWLHANVSDVAAMPDGKWMLMQDFLDTQSPVDAIRSVQTALQQGDLPSHVRNRLEDQVRKLTEAALRDAREGMVPPDATGAPELSDDPSSPNYRYRDTGYVAGSRKEMASDVIKRSAREHRQVLSTQVDWDDLEANPREAKALITKANLFGQTDWPALRAAGMEPGAGFLIDRLYASAGQMPSEDTPRARQDFTVGLQTLRARMEGCRTVADVQGAIDNFADEYDGKILTAEESAIYVSSTMEMRRLHQRERELEEGIKPFYDEAQSIDMERNRLLNEQGNRERRKWKPDPDLNERLASAEQRRTVAWDEWRSRLDAARPEMVAARSRRQAMGSEMQAIITQARVRNKIENPLSRAWTLMGDRFIAAIRYRRSNGSDAFAKHVATARAGRVTDWSWAESDGAPAKPRDSTKESVRFQLTVPDKFDRIGGRAVRVDSTAALKEMYGLRDVQSGNWVLRDQNSAKWHTERAAEAFADMADVLGVDDTDLAFKGRLALAFGARGHGASGFKDGAPRAHYEPIQRIINITKMQGGGTLGHEWFHALDNLISEAETGQPARSDVFVTETPDAVPQGPIRDALHDLQSAMFDGDERASSEMTYSARDHQMAVRNIGGSYLNAVARKIKAAADVHEAVRAVEEHFPPGSDGKMARKTKQLAKDWRQIAVAHHGGNPAGGSVTVTAGPSMSSYALQSARLDDGGTTYWSTGREMAARAFQSYVEDKLKAVGQRNDYLSCMADNRYHEGKPYPEGEERTRINAAFDQLFAALRARGTLAKAMDLLGAS